MVSMVDRADRATKLLPRDRGSIMDRRYFSCAALASYDDSEPPANPGRAFSQEEVNRLLAMTILDKQGHLITLATNGEEAVDE